MTIPQKSVDVQTQYIATMYVPLAPPQLIDGSTHIYPIENGGWFKGEGIDAEVVAPGADWLRILPSGELRLDVRLTLKVHDGQFIFMTYGGVITPNQELFDRLLRGETLTSGDLYFVTAPTMQTALQDYAWVNKQQFIGKMVEFKLGDNSRVVYDIFAVR